MKLYHRRFFLYMYLNVRVCVRVNVKVDVKFNAALPSVGSVVSRDMTHAITGRRGTLNQLLAIATTGGGSRREIQRLPPHIHTVSNTLTMNRKLSPRFQAHRSFNSPRPPKTDLKLTFLINESRIYIINLWYLWNNYNIVSFSEIDMELKSELRFATTVRISNILDNPRDIKGNQNNNWGRFRRRWRETMWKTLKVHLEKKGLTGGRGSGSRRRIRG